ncbi:MAG: PIN domain-containing protein [Gammaproteobacteria bacterium]
MSEIVLDASALLAYLNEEPGAEAVEEALARAACIGAANWAEVLSKAAENGVDPEVLSSQSRRSCPPAGRWAGDRPAAALDQGGRPVLGDRACLALGLRLGLPVLTTDRDWQRLDVEVRAAR